MRIEDLKLLLGISRTKSISKAAKSFYISHQGASNTIKVMEKELGFPLLIRSKTGISVTEEGQILLENAEKIVELYEDSLEKAKHNTIADLSGSLTIYSTTRLINMFVGEIISEFLNKYTNISVKLESLLSNEIVCKAVNQDCIGIISFTKYTWGNYFRNLIHKHRNITSSALMEIDQYVCFHNDSKWAEQDMEEYLDVAIFEQTPMALYGDEMINKNYNIYKLNSLEAQRQFIEDKNGVGFVTDIEYKKYYHKKGIFGRRPQPSGSELNVYYIVNNEFKSTKEKELFYNFLITKLKHSRYFFRM